MLDIRQNVEGVQAAIERACRRCGRDPREVLLIAVSKTVDLERIRLAVEMKAERPMPELQAEMKQNIAELDQLIEEILLASRLDATRERLYPAGGANR